ncbi:MAG: hypothetical protein ACXABY_05410 [Candidatus Thorarchaeota archaeon]|jgi:hypothetical protein
MQLFAPKVTHITNSDSPAIIESGASIIVYGFVVTAIVNQNPVVITTADAVTTLFTIDLSTSGRTEVMETQFIADQGIRVVCPADMTCSIFHSQGGA